MPSRRRRLSPRSTKLPLRTTSYRPPSGESPPPPLDSDLIHHYIGRTRSTATPTTDTCFDVPFIASVTPEGLSMTLPIPPSINRQYATVNGRRVLSSAGRTYKMQIGQQVWIALSRSPLKDMVTRRLRSRPLALSIRFFFTTPLRRDVDSGLKIAQDAVCEGLGLNDNRIVETHLYKHVDKLNPRMEVSLGLADPSSSAL